MTASRVGHENKGTKEPVVAMLKALVLIGAGASVTGTSNTASLLREQDNRAIL